MTIYVPFGGRVYGNHTDSSDYDYYVLVENFSGYKDEKINGDDYHFIGFDNFQKNLNICDIAAMEIYFSLDKIHQDKFEFVLDLEQLRRSISGVVSNSWVKAKKKMAQGDDYIGRKSMWHSLRILMFGIQVAKYGKIVDFSEANEYYDDIVKGNAPYSELVKVYKPIMNAKQSEFRVLCPKTW